MATRGYNSYRGRVSTGRIVLIVVLVLILLEWKRQLQQLKEA